MENKYAHSDFDSFYLEYSPKLWRLAYRLTRNRYDSEDLVDEAFLIYLQKSTTMVIDNPEAYISGKVVITVDVDALHTMTKIGATKIYLYESSDGKNFNLVRTYRYEDYPIMMSSGKHYYQDLFTYYGTAGYSYHALAYCYAGDSTGYDEKLFSTATKKAT